MNSRSSFREPRRCHRQKDERERSGGKSIRDRAGRAGVCAERAMPPPLDEPQSRHRGENRGASAHLSAYHRRSRLVLRARSPTVRHERERWRPPSRLARNRPQRRRIRFCGSRPCFILCRPDYEREPTILGEWSATVRPLSVKNRLDEAKFGCFPVKRTLRRQECTPGRSGGERTVYLSCSTKRFPPSCCFASRRQRSNETDAGRQAQRKLLAAGPANHTGGSRNRHGGDWLRGRPQGEGFRNPESGFCDRCGDVLRV